MTMNAKAVPVLSAETVLSRISLATKTCSKCRCEKSTDEFSKNKRGRGSFYSQCRECKNGRGRKNYAASDKAHQKNRMAKWYQANRQKVLSANKAWRRNNPDRVKELARNRHAANPLPRRESVRRWRRNHPEYRPPPLTLEARLRRRDGKRQYRVQNPDKSRMFNMARRARIMNAFDEFVSRKEVLARNNGICGICGQGVDVLNFVVDHIHPLAKEGRHSYANTQPAHKLCNEIKLKSVQLTCPTSLGPLVASFEKRANVPLRAA